jgi:hypothetical protein
MTLRQSGVAAGQAMKPVRRRLGSESNGYAEIGFPFLFSYLARDWRHIASLEALYLSAWRDAESATRAAHGLESLIFTVICARRRRVVIRRQYVRRRVSFMARSGSCGRNPDITHPT